MKNREYSVLTKDFWMQRKYALWALFVPIYLACFFFAERMIDGSQPYWVSYMPLDDMIPFCEYFVIPYYMWYPLLVAVGLYGLFKEEYAYKRYMLNLALTFFSSIIFFFILPNGQDLRPEYFEHTNWCTDLVGAIYSVDTNTNVFPSIHVVGALVAFIGVLDFKTLKHKKLIATITGILAFLICIATVFIKQHSVLDIIGGIIFTAVGYVIVYVFIDRKFFRPKREEN